jgi:hypothetical protein
VNFVKLYRPLASSWEIYDNSANGSPRLVAQGSQVEPPTILVPEVWDAIHKDASHE